VFVLAVLVVGGGAWLAWRQWTLRRQPRPAAAMRGDVLEGEFVVLDRHHAAR
jgi:hypothetical protein